MIDLNELERLAKAATQLPWEVKHLRTNHEFVFAQAPDCDMVFHAREEDVQYITAACNAVPELIKRVRELERQRVWLAGYAESVHTCSQCPAKQDNLCPPNEEDRARFSIPCINALIRWAEIITKENAERTEKFPWDVEE